MALGIRILVLTVGRGTEIADVEGGRMEAEGYHNSEPEQACHKHMITAGVAYGCIGDGVVFATDSST